MRTLLTGATGRLGSRLAPRLAARTPLRVLIRDPERVAPFWNQGYDVVLGDLRDPDAVTRAVRGVDAVVHLAAVSQEDTVALGRAALEAGVPRFVLAGTTRAYGPERALLDLYHDGGLGLRIVRLAAVYGAGDLARGLWLALTMDGADGRIFNLTGDGALTPGIGLPVPCEARPIAQLAGPVADLSL